MTNTFIDLQSGHWAYDDIIEATNTFLKDGTSLMEALPYQVFETGKRRVYQEFIAVDKQINFTLSKSITPSASNPLYVFVNGVQYSYRSVKTEKTTTVVTLNQPVAKGNTVSFLAPGVPRIENGRPYIKSESYHPHYLLKNSTVYHYFAGSGGRGEYLTVFGKQLRRAVIDEQDFKKGLSEQSLARKYIGFKNDRYIISPTGRLFLPHNFEGMGGDIIYYTRNSAGVITKRTEKFVAYSGTASDTETEPYFTDRFFPSANVERWEVIAVLNQLRSYYYERLTDSEVPGPNLDQEVTAYTGQKVFKLDTYYQAKTGALRVKILRTHTDKPYWALLKKDKDYIEFDNFTVLMTRPQEQGTVLRFEHEKHRSSHLFDVGRDGQYIVNGSNGQTTKKINGTTAPWVKHVLSVEHEQLKNGTYLIYGKSISSAETVDSERQYRVQVNGELAPKKGNQPVKRFFMPHTLITRSEAVGFISRFRRWYIERFS